MGGSAGALGIVTSFIGGIVKQKGIADEEKAKTDAAYYDIAAKQLQINEQNARTQFNLRQLDRQAQEASGAYSVKLAGQDASLSDLYDINYGYGMERLKVKRENDYNNQVLGLEIDSKQRSIDEIHKSAGNAKTGTFLSMGSEEFNMADTNSGSTAKASPGTSGGGSTQLNKTTTPSSYEEGTVWRRK